MVKSLLKLAVFVSVVFVSLSACAQAQQENAGQQLLSAAPVMTNVIMGESGEYTLGRDDIVQVAVRGQPEFSGQFIIGPDGNIQYTFIGDIRAADLTKDELEKSIISKLEKYVKVPEVNVSIAAYRSKFVYVLGEVGNPGKYPIAGDAVSLRDAIFAAGVPPYLAALRRTWVIKPDNTNPTATKVDLYKLLYQGKLGDNVVLSPGDIVVVPTSVPGEVNRALTTLLAPFTNAVGTASTATSVGAN